MFILYTEYIIAFIYYFFGLILKNFDYLLLSQARTDHKTILDHSMYILDSHRLTFQDKINETICHNQLHYHSQSKTFHHDYFLLHSLMAIFDSILHIFHHHFLDCSFDLVLKSYLGYYSHFLNYQNSYFD